MNYLHYICPESLDEAWRLNQKKSNRIVAGGLWLRYQKRPFDTAIDLSRLGLDQITETDDGYTIGAYVTLHQLESHDGLSLMTGGAFYAALCRIVGIQFRNAATVGGSVFSRFGFSDLIPLLCVLKAQVVLYGENGAYSLPIDEFIVKKPGTDILTAVKIEKRVLNVSIQTQRYASTGFPIMVCDSVLQADGTLLTAIGARPHKAVLFEQNPGESDESYISRVSEQAVFGTNSYATQAYRKHLAQVFMNRNIKCLKEGGDRA